MGWQSGSSITGALLPRWAQEGGRAGTLAMLKDTATRERMYRDMTENLSRRGGATRLMVSVFEPDRSLEGKTLAQVARRASTRTGPVTVPPGRR
ncbi:MAG: hypothetical protein Q8P50_10760 [Bacillota bacterium]|nr:hypothetical protein [Bacillota bacterium]